MNHTIQRWGDYDDSDDDATDNKIGRNSQPSKHAGIKARVNEVTRRDTWKSFGQAAIDRQNNVQTTYLATHEVFLEHPSASQSNDNEDSVFGAEFSTMVQHLKEGRKRRELALKYGVSPKLSSLFEGGQPVVTNEASTGYIPPHKRRPDQVTPRYRDQEDSLEMTKATTSIRVINLSGANQESDLHDLFSRFGRISRVYLATTKDAYTTSRGFGFVTFVHNTTT